MAIKQDGSQAFGIASATFNNLIVESFSKTFTSNRVDLDDGNGEPIGSTTVPGRVEGTLTCQLGTGSIMAVGDEVAYAGDTYIVTEPALNESQAEYVRVSVSCYKKIN